MTTPAWLSTLAVVVSADELVLPGARILADLLSSGTFDGARLVEVRRRTDGHGEVLIIEADAGLGQALLVHDIRVVEPIAIWVHKDWPLPSVYPLRADFPQDVSHFNIATADAPRSLCLFDGAREDVLRTYTPQRLLARIRWWLRETAYGRLHGNDQPLDPIFLSTEIAFILPADHVKITAPFYIGICQSDAERAPILLAPVDGTDAAKAKRQEPMHSAIVIETAPVRHGRIRYWPSNLAELLAIYRELGVDLEAELRGLIRAWSADQALAARLALRLLIIVRTPLRLESGAVAGSTTRGFLSAKASGRDIAAALGALATVGEYSAPIIGKPTTDAAALVAIEVVQVDIYHHFDRTLARVASGRAVAEGSTICLMGAGALGSQMALAAARGGIGVWTIADKDFLLPHNLARHALLARHIGAAKAEALAYEVRMLLGAGAATGVVCDVTAANAPAAWTEPLDNAARILDASASVGVARWLARNQRLKARAASCFLTPSGRDLVALMEGNDRRPQLDHLEMSYYWHLVIDEELHGHLVETGGVIRPGSCRSPSMQIPQTAVSAFASIAAEVLCETEWPEPGQISIWRTRGVFDEVKRHCYAGETYLEVPLGDWKVVVRRRVLELLEEARVSAGRLETGGIVVGTWDRERKIVYIVGSFDPPPDSHHQPSGFVRGAVGVFKTIEEVETRTAANLTYIGEWHSHPPGSSSRPSADDGILLRWIGDALKWSDAPACMLIAAEEGVRLIGKTAVGTASALLGEAVN